MLGSARMRRLPFCGKKSNKKKRGNDSVGVPHGGVDVSK